MSSRNYTSLLVLLGIDNALQGFDRPDFFHPRFFIHCVTRDQCIATLGTYANIVGEMDVFLPHSAVDLIQTHGGLPNPRRRFHLYCETEDFVNQYKRLMDANICAQVFNVNQIQEKLYKTVHLHHLYCINDLERRSEAGDVDTDDLLVSMGELLEQSAAKINEAIRQKSCLPKQPAEDEPG